MAQQNQRKNPINNIDRMKGVMFSRGLNEIAVNMIEANMQKKSGQKEGLQRSPSLNVTHDVTSQETETMLRYLKLAE